MAEAGTGIRHYEARAVAVATPDVQVEVSVEPD